MCANNPTPRQRSVGAGHSTQEWSHVKRRPDGPTEHRILIYGPSRYENWDVLKAVLHHYRPTVIIHGHGRGVDLLCSLYAQIFSIDEFRFPAQWFVYGTQAPQIRNAHMFSVGKPDMLIDFTPRDSEHDLWRQATAARMPVVFVDERDWVT